MKITVFLSVIGLLLFVIASSDPFSNPCFHCVPSYSIEPATAILGFSTLIILSVALFRLLKFRVVKQQNSYGSESLLQFIPYESYPPVGLGVKYPVYTDFGLVVPNQDFQL